jgi:hypothetical protein
MFDPLDFLVDLLQHIPQSASSSSGATGCTAPAQKGGGKTCPGLRSERRAVGRPLTNISLADMAWVMHCYLTTTKRSPSARANAPGPEFSRRSMRSIRWCARRAGAHPSASDYDRAVLTTIGSQAPQLTVFLVILHGRRMSVPWHKRFRSSWDLSYLYVYALK